jgi:AraC-like DNA-binding protein
MTKRKPKGAGLKGPPEFFSPQVVEARRFYLDPAPPAAKPVAVVCGGCERCAPDYAIHRTTFPYYSIEFVARGKGALILGGKEYALFPGAVFSYGPGIAQDIFTDVADPLIKYFVDFVGSRAVRMLGQGALAPGNVARVFAPGEVQWILDDLILNGLKGTRFASRICDVLLEYLILKIADSLMPWEASKTPAFATYQRCRQHIQAQYLRLQTQQQIASECHINPAYLCRLFRRYDHQTPYQYLMRLKMNVAAERLQDPGRLVKQVSHELGFSDPFHFSRAFKSVFGVSPDAFRRLRCVQKPPSLG